MGIERVASPRLKIFTQNLHRNKKTTIEPVGLTEGRDL